MIYLDHHAATPMVEGAAQAMQDAQAVGWANPSSVHTAGRRARALLERAREQVAAAVGAHPADVVLTGGGSEACNLGVWGMTATALERVVTTRIEHPAVAAAVERLEGRGKEVVRLDVPQGHAPSADELGERIIPGRTLVCVGWINHETGTVLPVDAYAQVCRARGARLFVDAIQALGKVPVDVAALGADAVAVASHKVGGPAGAAALWVRRGSDCDPVLVGGGQERGRRAGTPDVIAHVGFGAACEAVPDRLARMPEVASLRDALEATAVREGAVVNAGDAPRVATVSCLSVPGWKGEVLVAALDLEGVCASSGAACSSGRAEPSAVVAAMYPAEPWRAAASLRLSLGPETSATDVQVAGAALGRVIARGAAQSAGA
jgi:cysteine desulfurase